MAYLKMGLFGRSSSSSLGPLVLHVIPEVCEYLFAFFQKQRTLLFKRLIFQLCHCPHTYFNDFGKTIQMHL